MFVTVVISHVRESDTERFADLAARHAENCETKEPGCVSFRVVRDSDRPNVFAFIETYQDEPGFQDHLASDHLRWWKEVTAGVFQGKPTVVRGLVPD